MTETFHDELNDEKGTYPDSNLSHKPLSSIEADEALAHAMNSGFPFIVAKDGRIIMLDT